MNHGTLIDARALFAPITLQSINQRLLVHEPKKKLCLLFCFTEFSILSVTSSAFAILNPFFAVFFALRSPLSLRDFGVSLPFGENERISRFPGSLKLRIKWQCFPFFYGGHLPSFFTRVSLVLTMHCTNFNVWWKCVCKLNFRFVRTRSALMPWWARRRWFGN